MALSRFKPTAGNRSASNATHSILYVEDEDTNWEVTEFALRDRYQLTRASTSREAFRLLRNNRYDLILMDIQLSGSELSGIEITQIVRGKFEGDLPVYALHFQPCKTPIVFVTAYTARYKKEELLKAGGDDMIMKPVDFTRLSLAISRLLVRGIHPT